MALEISIDNQRELFKEHLDDTFNDRIIFSGAFGIGKTYFLDKFFALEKNNYFAIRLAPINYSVSNSEDIFKLIKYDIIFEMALSYARLLEETPISWNIALGTLLPNQAEAIYQGILPLLQDLNKPFAETQIVVAPLFLAFSNVIKKIKKDKESAEKPTDALDFTDGMIKTFQLETDYATQFIEDSLNKIVSEASNDKEKLKVLVIDDLDRIDPEHIFRLFNIFSAHFDYNKTNRNKFGFDKVVFVCDINNIRNIFHTQYGTNTDFTGYIDKFFSKEIFHFSNEEQVGIAVEEFIKAISPSDESSKHYLLEHITQNGNYRQKGLLTIILTELVISGALRMRRFSSSYGMNFSIPTKSLSILGGDYAKSAQYWKMPILVTLEILSKIMGGSQALAKGIEIVVRSKRSNYYHESTRNQHNWLLGHILPLVDYSGHRFSTSMPNQNAIYSYRGIEGLPIDYSLLEGGSRRDTFFAQPAGTYSDTLFFLLVQKALETLIQDGILK
jgi:KAP family P-loop domain